MSVRLALATSMAGLPRMGAWAEPVGLFADAALLAVGQGLAFPALMTLAVRAPPTDCEPVGCRFPRPCVP